MAFGLYGQGNWGGLPELGITETLFGGKKGSIFDAGMRTTDYNYNQASQDPSNPYYNQPQAPTTNINQPSPTSNLVKRTGSTDNPTIPTSDEPSEQDKLAQQYGFDDYADYLDRVKNVKNVYDKSSDYLDTLENRIRGGEQDYYNIYTTPYSSQIPLVQSNAQAGISNLQNQQGLAQYQEQDALSAARRLYNELTARNRQAFGGVSSVGQAASEIGARELQSQMGTVKNTAAQTIQGIVTKINDVQSTADAMIQQLTQQKEAALSQAKLAFQDKLSEIDNMRNTINQQKAQLKLDALKEFRDRIQYLQDVQTQRTYELENMKAQAVQSLQAQATELQDYLGMQNETAGGLVSQAGDIYGTGQQNMQSANAIGGQSVNAQSIFNNMSGLTYSPYSKREKQSNIFA